MKKELNGKSRRKWVAGGAMVFGSIALLSTGFATWVIGASNNTADGKINVSIDTVDNKSVDLKATVDTKNDDITFGDTTEVSDGVVKVNKDGVNTNVDISVSLTAICSEGYLGNDKSTNPGKVSVAIKGTSNLIPVENINGAHASANQNVPWTRTPASKIKADNDAFTVFGLETTSIASSSWTEDMLGAAAGTRKFTATATIKFTIGGNDLWNSKTSFAEYVNSLYNTDMVGETKHFATSTEMYGEIETQMEAELNTIKTHFGTNPLTITLSVGKDAPDVQQN